MMVGHVRGGLVLRHVALVALVVQKHIALSERIALERLQQQLLVLVLVLLVLLVLPMMFNLPLGKANPLRPFAILPLFPPRTKEAKRRGVYLGNALVLCRIVTSGTGFSLVACASLLALWLWLLFTG